MVAAMHAESFGVRRRVPWRTALLLSLSCAVGFAIGCASDVGPGDPAYRGGYQSPELGFSVAHPGGPMAEGWRSISVEGADYAVRGPDGGIYSVGARCRRTAASVKSLARHLFIGTQTERVLKAGPIEHAGLPGYRQRVQVAPDEDRGPLTIDAVTLKQGACVYDLVLIERGDAPSSAAESTFDPWWRSFRSGAGPEAETDSGESGQAAGAPDAAASQAPAKGGEA
jgi:hypothetical protein